MLGGEFSLALSPFRVCALAGAPDFHRYIRLSGEMTYYSSSKQFCIFRVGQL